MQCIDLICQVDDFFSVLFFVVFIVLHECSNGQAVVEFGNLFLLRCDGILKVLVLDSVRQYIFTKNLLLPRYVFFQLDSISADGL